MYLIDVVGSTHQSIDFGSLRSFDEEAELNFAVPGSTAEQATRNVRIRGLSELRTRRMTI